MAQGDDDWRPVKGFEGFYEVSREGRIRSLDRVTYGRNKSLRTVRGKDLTPKINNVSGYHQVALSVGGQVRYEYIHRIVCQAYSGPPPTEKHEVCHWDGDRANNLASNLRWGTRAENHRDKKRHGTHDSPKKLTRQSAEEIRELKRSGERSVDIANTYGVTPGNVDQIVRGRIWRNVTEKETH